MTDIFFSYSSKDRERVAIAHTALTERGFDAFWDLQVPANTSWSQWIKAELGKAPCVLVFWTKDSVLSDNVQHEVEIARKDGKLIQVLLDPLDTRDLPMGLLANQAARLMDWQGDTADPEWAKLIAAVEEKAMPQWLRQKMGALDVSLKAERGRVAEADAKVRSLEEAHSREVAAQGDLRRERDRLQLSLQAERESVAKSREHAAASARDAAASAEGLRRERDNLKAECSRVQGELRTVTTNYGRQHEDSEKLVTAALGRRLPPLLVALSLFCAILSYFPRLIEIVIPALAISNHHYDISFAFYICAILVPVSGILFPVGEYLIGDQHPNNIAKEAAFMLALTLTAFCIVFYLPISGLWQIIYLLPSAVGIFQGVLIYLMVWRFFDPDSF